MNRVQRVIVVIYLLAVTYCFLWVPWCIHWHTTSDSRRLPLERVGYGWLWGGLGNTPYSRLAAPDFPLIGMRLVAATALCLAAYLVLNLSGRSHHAEASERQWPKLSDKDWKVVAR